MDYRLLPDEVLLKFLKISDELAYKEIYQRYWRSLYHTIRNKINRGEVAEDIVQNVFTDLWHKRERHSIENLSGYLNASVKYQVINYIKSAISTKIHLTIVGERQRAEENTAEIPLLVEELNQAIDKAINKLPKKTQAIFRLSRLERQSNKEISRIMDLSEKAVEYHITQSLKTLRIHLKDFMPGNLTILLSLLFLEIS